MSASLIAQQLRAERERQVLTITQVAKRMGYSRAAVSTWESGTRQPPLDLVEKWAGVLGVKVVVASEARPVEVSLVRRLEDLCREILEGAQSGDGA